MARAFTSAGSKSLIATSAAVTAAPMTLAAWANPNNTTDAHIVLAVLDSGVADPNSDSFYISFTGSAGGDPVQAFTAESGTFSGASTSTSFSAGVWQHACGVFASTTDRSVFLNGAGKGTNATLRNPSGITRTSIGFWETSAASFPANASVAEAAIWNAALTDDEVAVLAAGICPLFVRPTKLVGYWPLFGRGGATANEEDWIGERLMVQTNSPAVADHPRIIYPRHARLILPNTVVSAAPVAKRYVITRQANQRAAFW